MKCGLAEMSIMQQCSHPVISFGKGGTYALETYWQYDMDNEFEQYKL